MAAYGVADAKAQLSNLIERSLRGETVVITRHGKPAVRLLPLEMSEPVDVTALRAALTAQPVQKHSVARQIVAARRKAR